MKRISGLSTGQIMKRKTMLILLLVLTLSFSACSVAKAQLLRPQDILKLPSSPADHRIQYGGTPLQFGDLRVPKTGEPHPVAVVIHGGCWITKFADLQIMAAMSDALTKAVVVIGHSAGGHLALWAAARHRLPKTSPLFKPDPLRALAVINLAGPGDLKKMLPTQQRVCGDVPITKLVGGSPEDVAERYRDASPAEMLPLGVEQILITGAKDGAVPPDLGKNYEEEARRKGDKARMTVVEEAGHFEVIAPGTSAWKFVEEAVLTSLKFSRTGKVNNTNQR
jgi:pimeloyl-ACP methyl ester carboxylesterase